MYDTTKPSQLCLMSLYQEKFQDIQEFRDQYMAMKRVCDELGIKFGRCEDDAKAMLVKQKGITELKISQSQNATS